MMPAMNKGMTDKIEVKAEGLLRHGFYGDYSATVVLIFPDAETAQRALALPLMAGWKVGTKPNALTWVGGSEELETLKARFGELGADTEAIDSVAHSVDYGDPFEVTYRLEVPGQKTMF